MYKGTHNMAPRCIIDLLKPNEPKRNNMLSNKAGLKLKVPLVKYNTSATRSFSYAAATLWNSLPTNISEGKSLDKFKCSLKTHLYRKAFNLQLHTYYWLPNVKGMYKCYKLYSLCEAQIKTLQTVRFTLRYINVRTNY